MRRGGVGPCVGKRAETGFLVSDRRERVQRSSRRQRFSNIARVMRSPVFPLQLRLACANSLVRNEPPSQPTDFSQLSREQLEEQVIDLNARCYSEEEWAERCRKVSCRREELKAAGLYPHDHARSGREHPGGPVINGHAQPEAKGPPGGDKARSAAGGEY